MKPLSKRNLRSYIKRGLVLVRKKYHYTDDYAFDAAYNFQEEKEFKIATYHKDEDKEFWADKKSDEKATFSSYDLSNALLWSEDNDRYTLSFGFMSYELIIKEAVKAA